MRRCFRVLKSRGAVGRIAVLAAWLALGCESQAAAAAESAGLEFFEKRIRPLLAEHCYECHGVEKQKGGLRLDSRDGWQHGGESGPAIVPGDPENSRLIRGVRYDDPEFRMPPKRRLSSEQVALLEQWVRMGAPDPRTTGIASQPKAGGAAILEKGRDHWAYQLPKKVAPPETRNPTWPHNDIDRFVLARLESQGLPVRPEAERSLLIRRVYFDLIGLPPTPEEIDAFLNDTANDAFARVVDRLLHSPRFGERWARHWLDVARYAESVTLRGFIFKEAWRYRDYVIEAFNRDLPYDQFVREQIAGDLLPADSIAERQRQMVATSFLMLGNTNLEEQDKKQLDMDFVDEQLDTMGKAFLAQTIGCARCHDHKFDPIPTRDYYAMAGILRGVQPMKHANVSEWVERPLPVEPDEEARFAAQEKAIAQLQAALKEAKSRIAKKTPPASAPLAPQALPGIVVDDALAKRVGEWVHSQHTKTYVGDGYLHDGDRDKGSKTVTFHPETLRAGRYEVRLAYTPGANRAARVPVTILHADGESTVDVNQQEPAALDGRFVALGQFRFEANGQGYVLIANEGTKGHVIADAVQFLPIEALAGAGNVNSSSGSGKPASETASPNEQEEVRRLEAELKRLVESGPKRPMVMTVAERGAPSDIPIHVRGSVHNLGPVVPRGFLQVASYGQQPVIPSQESGRRELADWIASDLNPLTARVFVNRVWHWLFGAGLVRTVDNFGTTGETPSHPELLDNLALSFIEEGWSMKKLIRQIVLSRTYQMASGPADGTPLPLPARRRLDAESIRDSVLFLSGQLRWIGGGPTIRPGTTADYAYRHEENWRSVYVPVFRNALPEIFEAFDFADPSMVTGARNTSTVPPQALFLMNHPWVGEQARSAAKRLLEVAGLDDAERVERVYRMALGRPPTERERLLALRHVGPTTPDATRLEERVERWAELWHALFASMDFRYID